MLRKQQKDADEHTTRTLKQFSILKMKYLLLMISNIFYIQFSATAAISRKHSHWKIDFKIIFPFIAFNNKYEREKKMDKIHLHHNFRIQI